jgi:hypothetical protein
MRKQPQTRPLSDLNLPQLQDLSETETSTIQGGSESLIWAHEKNPLGLTSKQEQQSLVWAMQLMF